MDRRGYSSYIGFDGCDPFESVIEWSGRGERAARVLRRRCRSEGVERSPYEDSHAVHDTEHSRHQKTYFTLNHCQERFHHECILPAAENGDYLMAQEHRRSYSAKPKSNRLSPTRPLLVTSVSGRLDDSRLPKVEELLEKVDQEMMEVSMAKQPLKSILNNPIAKSSPQGILKKPKPKTYQDPKFNVEGRRRQRASSESDNLIGTSHLGAPIPGYDSRLTYLSPVSTTLTKRAKDNSGSGYSYGSAIASLSLPVKSANYTKNRRCSCKDQVVVKGQHDSNEVHILRTTAINCATVHEEAAAKPKLVVPPPPATRPATPPPTTRPATPPPAPALNPALTSPKCKSPKKKKCKPKSPNKKAGAEGRDDSPRRSPSPDAPNFDATWQMETDALLAEIHKLEASSTAPSRPADTKKDSVTKTPSKLTNGAGVAAKKVPVKEDSPLTVPESVASCLRPSLFPRVPPYLRFVSHDEAAPLRIPVGIAKHLKWKLTTITPIVVKKTLTNSGFRLVKSECDTSECPQEETVEWIGIWGKHMKSLMFRAIKDGQKMNHFPGTFQIGRKDRLWRNLQKLTGKFGEEEFGIMPKTYVLPHDLKLLKHDWERHAANNEKWIIKPPASARGTGIKVVSRWTQIPKKRPVVVQRYVNKPYLINGSKFDMRLYVLVTSVHPLRVYLYRDGLARFASVKYNDEIASLNDRYMHLTNYSINRLSKNYTPNEDFAACEGHKWTLLSLFQYLKTKKKVDTEALWESMKDLVIKTIISGEASISSLTKANITSRYNCYELFGIDVLLDEDLKPWLLEVNISPSLHSASPLDIHVKGPLVTTVLNVAQFQIPIKTNLESLTKEKPNKLGGLPYDCRLYTVYLSKEERDKHIIYTNMEDRDMYLRDVLSTLTPDDVRHLIQAEDELSACGADMQRIFPQSHTHRYLPYLSGPRYYNRLFDAWETRYANHRENGLELLRTLCDIGYHLEVPPVPLKLGAGALSALDRCRMMWTRRRLPRANAPRCCHSRSSPRVAPHRRAPPPVTPRRLLRLARPRRPLAPNVAPAPAAAGDSDKPVDLNRNETAADRCRC